MEWIDISEIENTEPKGSILVWQDNKADPDSSRFQRAVYFSGIIDIYPLVYRSTFEKSKDWIGYDIEGDLCQITQFALVKPPQ